jgi:hypothetical protein
MAIKRYALDIERTVRAKRLRDDGQVIRRFVSDHFFLKTWIVPMVRT